MDNGKTFVMCDLETLGVLPGCKVLSIGCVVFGPAGLGMEFYCECFRDFQGDLTEDLDTVAWWEKQDPQARDKLLDQAAPGKVMLAHALNQLNTWLVRVGGVDDKGAANITMWGNGASFDNAILEAAYDAADCAPAWGYYSDRCYRTLKAMAPQVKLVRSGTHHNALDDAKSQAGHAVRILWELRAWNR